LRFGNVYEDPQRAAGYAALEFPGTYYLAYRDLPELIAAHVVGRRALDFGCGTGRSTRFLKRIGFEAVGLDIAEDMLKHARELDPEGDYRLTADEQLGDLPANAFDLVTAIFTFDNVPSAERKVTLLQQLGERLAGRGRIINLVSAPEIYQHEWASFTTREFLENRKALSGDVVRIVMIDVPDSRPVEDVLFTDASYREVYRRAGLDVLAVHRPLGRPDEPIAWVTEREIAPWAIYVLGRSATRPAG